MTSAIKNKDLPPEPALLNVYAGIASALTPILHISKPLLKSYGGFKDTVPERLGKFSPVLDELEKMRGTRKLVWMHAVSVGEAAVAGALIESIKLRAPDSLIAVSTTTLTGRDFIEKNTTPDALFFFPLDLPAVMNRLVEKLRPDCFIDIEVELWPNCIRALTRAGVPIALANGRISDRAAKPPAIYRPILSWALGSFDALFMRSKEDVDRAVKLGAPADRTHHTGNLKFAAAGKPLKPDERRELRDLMGVAEDEFLFVAGSTHPGEDGQVIEAWKALNSELNRDDTGHVTLVIAPRHLEQVENISALFRDYGYDPALWTEVVESGAMPDNCRVIVLNTIGELNKLYGAADAAFVGGSLVERGGHNVLEPVAMGVPTLHGPSMANFHDLVRDLGEAGLLIEVSDSKELASGVLKCLTEMDKSNYRNRAAELIDRQLKAADNIGDWVASTLETSR